MDKANAIVLIILVLLVVAAALFYTNTGENHRMVSVGSCELKCQNLTASGATYSNYCAAKDISYGYSCAISQNVNASICGNTTTIYVTNSCELLDVG